VFGVYHVVAGAFGEHLGGLALARDHTLRVPVKEVPRVNPPIRQQKGDSN